jgi:hypothetical protein
VREYVAAETHFCGEFAALDREATIEQGEAVNLFFVGGVGEAAVDFAFYFLAPRRVPSGWLLAPY